MNTERSKGSSPSKSAAAGEWTFETMYSMLARQVEDLAVRMDERHATQQEEIRAGDENLQRYFDTRINDLMTAGQVRDSMLDERYATQTRAVDKALAAQQGAVDKAREADQKAVDKALEAAEKAVDRRQDQADKEFHEHLEQVRHENALAHANAEKVVQAAFDSNRNASLKAQEAFSVAITKAEAANDKRFEGVNEFRAQLNDQARDFMPREVADATFKELRGQIATLSSRMDTQSGRSSGYAALYGWAVAGVGIIITIILFANGITN